MPKLTRVGVHVQCQYYPLVFYHNWSAVTNFKEAVVYKISFKIV
jgi:hypothetical protein